MGRCDRIRQRFYTPERYDNSQMFLDMIEKCVRQGTRVLDLGAGAGLRFQYNLKSRAEPGGEVVGADFDRRVCENPLLHRGVLLNGETLPFGDETFDVVFCRSVLEHVAEPATFLEEVWRVLKPGGSFLFLTPNKRHYVCLAARCTPERFHEWYNKKRGRDESDTFPTLYRLNTRSAVRGHLRKAGFVEKEIRMRECSPNYLALAVPLFIMGIAYERLVNSTEWLSGFRVNILGHFVKPSQPSRM
ncbi:MAG: class I SAM-dependent methyltransferase [Phycisphaerales bacterium]